MSDIDLVKKVRVYAGEAEKNGFEVLTVPLRDLFPLLGSMEAAERERDELRKVLQETQVGLIDSINHASQLQAELSRRDAAEGDPDGYIFCHPSGKNFWSVSHDDTAGHNGVKPFYFAAAPAVLPPAMTYAEALKVCDWKNDQASIWVEGANWMRQQCLELGAQQQNFVELPDRKFRECVNGLLEEAIAYAGTQQLRARLSTRLSNFVKPQL
ncbi:hypothetical protein [Erwinia aphidicola]|uniref:hypothetical protein n=1 Tax=Erwinia aphidicola TaxID=68334 RepID=UPI003D2231E5